jgi:hypothetical protein
MAGVSKSTVLEYKEGSITYRYDGKTITAKNSRGKEVWSAKKGFLFESARDKLNALHSAEEKKTTAGDKSDKDASAEKEKSTKGNGVNGGKEDKPVAKASGEEEGTAKSSKKLAGRDRLVDIVSRQIKNYENKSEVST